MNFFITHSLLHAISHTNTSIFSFFFQMAAIPFDHALDRFQSKHSLLKDLLRSYEGLHFSDICYALPQRSLQMQQVPINYLLNVVDSNAFQPEGSTTNSISGSTAILIMFLSDVDFKGMEHIHIDLMVHCADCKLYDQSGILPFIETINNDLEKAQKRGSKSGPCSYSLLVANYGGIIVVPTEPPYCLIYPTMYETEVPAEDQHHFNTRGNPVGMHTGACMCLALLQLADTQPALQLTFKGSCLIIPHGTQYKNLFPEIMALHNHWGPLKDPKTGLPFPMEAVEVFCLVDRLFPGIAGASLVFCKADLTELKD